MTQPDNCPWRILLTDRWERDAAGWYRLKDFDPEIDVMSYVPAHFFVDEHGNRLAAPE